MDASDWMILLSSNRRVVYYQMHLYCVFPHQKVKIVISNLNHEGVFPKYGSHAIVKKERVKVCFFLSCSPYSCFGLDFRQILMPHMCCEMQNKLSKTSVSPLGSM